MSRTAVEQVIARAMVEADFRRQLIDNARVACMEYDLTEEELAALEALDNESLKTFAGTLDVRISKTGGKGFI